MVNIEEIEEIVSTITKQAIIVPESYGKISIRIKEKNEDRQAQSLVKVTGRLLKASYELAGNGFNTILVIRKKEKRNDFRSRNDEQQRREYRFSHSTRPAI